MHLTDTQMGLLKDIWACVVPSVPPLEADLLLNDLLRAAYCAKGTPLEHELNRLAFAALDIVGERRRELHDIVAVARAAPDGRLYLELEEREKEKSSA